MTHKVMECQRCGYGDYIICVRDTAQKYNQFIIYRKWYDRGWHRKRLTAYADFNSVIAFLFEIMVRRRSIEDALA